MLARRLPILCAALMLVSAAQAQDREEAGAAAEAPDAASAGERPAGDASPEEERDEPDAAAGRGEGDAPCVPPCRDNYSCANGVCVSDCNPPCAPGTVCSNGGRCVTDAYLRAEPSTWNWPRGDIAAEKSKLSEHNHDGFYLRYSAGIGYLFDWLDSPADATIEGVGAGIFDLQVGGTPGKGFVIGGGVTYVFVPEPRYEDDLARFNMSGRLRISVFGPFVDYYPDTHSGLHLGATIGLGLAYYRMQRDEDDPDDEVGRPDPGIGVSPQIGYDFWIDEQLSLGLLVRLTYIAADDEYDTGHSVLFPMLSASVVYH